MIRVLQSRLRWDPTVKSQSAGARVSSGVAAGAGSGIAASAAAGLGPQASAGVGAGVGAGASLPSSGEFHVPDGAVHVLAAD